MGQKSFTRVLPSFNLIFTDDITCNDNVLELGGLPKFLKLTLHKNTFLLSLQM